MTIMSKIVIGQTISFDVYPSAILGTGFKNCKVLAVVDADTALLLGIDPVATHISVYPTLPSTLGVPNRYDGYQYVKLKLATGKIAVIGIPYIKEETIVVSSAQKGVLEFEGINIDILNSIVAACVANGYTPTRTDLV